MPSRDPETGQYVSEMSDKYDELEVQSLATTYSLSPSDVEGGGTEPYTRRATPVEYPDGPTKVLNGSLERGEMAELVALIVHSTSFRIEGTDDQTSPTTGRARFELSDEHAPSVSRASEPGSLPDSYVNVQRESDLNSRILYHTNRWANASWLLAGADDPGIGGTGSAMNGDSEILNYRDLAGQGPVFDRYEDELYEHIDFVIYNSLNQPYGVNFEFNATMLWDVTEA
jgi:hypothetical protein